MEHSKAFRIERARATRRCNKCGTGISTGTTCLHFVFDEGASHQVTANLCLECIRGMALVYKED